MRQNAETSEWPRGGAEMARLIRATDWAATPLGPVADWPERLRGAVEQMLDNPLVASLVCGPERIFFYNDTAARLYGDRHPGAFGRPLPDSWPGPYASVAAFYDRVFAGEAIHLPAQPLDVSGQGGEVFDVVLTPVRDAAGSVVAASAVGVEVGARIRAEARLRESEERQAYLLKLSDELRSLTDPIEIQQAACRVLGEHVGANRVLYGDVIDERVLVLRRNYVNGVEPLIATLEVEAFGRHVIADYKRGARIVFADVTVDPRYGEEDRRNHLAIGVVANASLGLVKDGRWIAAIGMHQAHPRVWTPLEVALLEETAERTWAAVERARAEAELRDLAATLESRVEEAVSGRRLLADVFEGTDAMISVADRDLRLLAFNRPYADEVVKLGGRRPEVGRSILDLYAGKPHLAAPVEANWRRAVAGETFSVTEEHGEADRYRRSYERRFEPIRDPEGHPIGAYQYATDVTDRLLDQRRAAEAEAARREADALYRAYFQNSGEGLFVIAVDPSGRFVIEESNPADRALLGRLGVELKVGVPLDEQLPPEALDLVTAQYRRVLETGEVLRYSASAPGSDRVIHFETMLVPVRDETGRIARIMGSTRDMTAQVAAEEALRQSQKMDAMGQLTGGVAHDFNNLLTPILGGLDRLHRKGVGDDRDRRMIAGALQSAERARTLVQRLLAFARRQPLQPAAVDVAEVMRGMADLVASTTGPRIDVAVEAEPGLPAALADANQLEMAILNLAVNARDAMPDGGRLRIAARACEVRPGAPGPAAPGHYVSLSVADNGIGMDEAVLARAVEPFFSTKGVGRGTGLGLSMVHGLAAQLGGALAIRSRPGQGTEVELWLPAAQAPRPASSSSAGPSPDAVGADSDGTVLLVDDEDLVRAATADMLAELGYHVVEAGTAAEALRRIDQGLVPDLVVTDHLMPGMSGTELAGYLMRQRPGLRVLIVSGYADVDGIAPDLPRLAKPFRRDELAASLRALRG